MIKFKEFMIDYIIDKLSTNILVEMAHERSKARELITSLSYQVLTHCIKVLYWYDNINYEKHINDIDTWLNTIDGVLLKPKSKKPKQQDLYNWMFDCWVEDVKSLNRIIHKLSKDYNTLERTNISNEELYNKLKFIFNDLSKDISNDEFSSIRNYI